MFLDCTLRDGGYYNSWDFSDDMINEYIDSVVLAGVDVIELGMRTLSEHPFKGACAYTSDDLLKRLNIPDDIKISVMINASEVIGVAIKNSLQRLFPLDREKSNIDIVRVACHGHEFMPALDITAWLKGKGFDVGINIMQVSEFSYGEIESFAAAASQYDIDVLYIADSMGCIKPDEIATISTSIRKYWRGPIGIHAHDNMGLALSNTLRAMDEGITWVDSTVAGMGRGPGNARTEELAIEMAGRKNSAYSLVPIMALINKYFKPMRERYGWGSNPYYYLAGKYGIHPSYIQEMISDSRYDEEDILAVIEHLRVEGGKKFNPGTLDAARHFFQGEPRGSWNPADMFYDRDVLLLGSGPGVALHRIAIEQYIRRERPLVVALNTQSSVESELIDVRVACHPVRMLADCEAHTKLPQPLITPASMLPHDVKRSLGEKELLDYGLTVKPYKFEFESTFCTVPSSLVIAYALAVATSGKAKCVFMAGFDGYGADDPRTTEMQEILSVYQQAEASINLVAVTPTKYLLPMRSIYSMG